MSGNYIVGSSFTGSTVIGELNINQGASMSFDPDDLEELRRIQKKLESSVPEIAEQIDNLRKAIEKKDTDSFQAIKKELSGKLIVSILTNAATGAGKIALRHLGIL